MLENKQVDLSKELDQETKRRVAAEEAYEQLKEQYLKYELEQSREKADLLARIDNLEQEKQALHLKLMRFTDSLNKDTVATKEKEQTYMEMLGESR